MNPDSGVDELNLSTESQLPALGGYPSGEVALRRFGIYQSDLAVDFDQADKAKLMTELLELCALDPGKHLPQGYFQELSLGRRLQYLLNLSAGGELTAFSFPFKCSGCREDIELELTLAECAELQNQADEIKCVEVEVQGRRLSFRKPNGRDQEKWTEMIFQDQVQATLTMIRSLALSQDLPPTLSPETMARIEDAMEAADPLVNFLCNITCSECGTANQFFIDLCDAALSALKRMQKRLLGSVHTLASFYHWNERDIFAIPDWRRNAYLNLIAASR